MARRKTKLTPFARFFIFLLIAAPLAYLGASYYNGEDGIGKVKEMFGNNSEDERTETESDPSETMSVDAVTARLKDELNDKNRRLDSLYEENQRLKKELETLRNSGSTE
jgi:cell division protein FtsB